MKMNFDTHFSFDTDIEILAGNLHCNDKIKNKHQTSLLLEF